MLNCLIHNLKYMYKITDHNCKTFFDLKRLMVHDIENTVRQTYFNYVKLCSALFELCIENIYELCITHLKIQWSDKSQYYTVDVTSITRLPGRYLLDFLPKFENNFDFEYNSSDYILTQHKLSTNILLIITLNNWSIGPINLTFFSEISEIYYLLVFF